MGTIHLFSCALLIAVRIECMHGSISEQTGKDSIELDDGKYSYPFSYKLPPNAPSSYEATIGRVRYYLEATIDRPWAFDRHTKAMITVINMLDLNTMPNLMVRNFFNLVSLSWSLNMYR